MKRLSNTGDTIVEVVLAMAMLALVLFSSWAITNRASQINLTARQRVEMVNQLKEQAELLKSKWASGDRIASLATVVSVPSNPCVGLNLSDANSDPVSAGYMVVAKELPTDSTEKLFVKSGSKQVKGDLTQRVWVQRQDKGTYTDFYIRGCWVVTGGGQNKLDNSQFIVRLAS